MFGPNPVAAVGEGVQRGQTYAVASFKKMAFNGVYLIPEDRRSESRDDIQNYVGFEKIANVLSENVAGHVKVKSTAK